MLPTPLLVTALLVAQVTLSGYLASRTIDIAATAARAHDDARAHMGGMVVPGGTFDPTRYADWGIAAAAVTATIPMTVALALVPATGTWLTAVAGVLAGGLAGVGHASLLATSAEAVGAPPHDPEVALMKPNPNPYTKPETPQRTAMYWATRGDSVRSQKIARRAARKAARAKR